MAKKLLVIGAAIALVFAVAFVAADGSNAVACDKNNKDTAASASAAKTREAGSTKTASSACCAKKTASAAAVASTHKAGVSGCTRTTTAQVASTGCCAKKGAAAASVAATSCSGKASYAVAGTGCSAKSASVAACRDGARADVAGYSKTGEDRAEAAKARTAELGTFVDEVPYMEPRRMVVTGSMACGHCTYEKTAGCAPLLKTTDGKVYPLLPGQLVDKMKHTAAPNGLRVSTNVQKVDGLRYLDVKAFQEL